MLFREYTPKDDSYDDNLAVDLYKFGVGEINSADIEPGAAEILMAMQTN